MEVEYKFQWYDFDAFYVPYLAYTVNLYITLYCVFKFDGVVHHLYNLDTYLGVYNYQTYITYNTYIMHGEVYDLYNVIYTFVSAHDFINDNIFLPSYTNNPLYLLNTCYIGELSLLVPCDKTIRTHTLSIYMHWWYIYIHFHREEFKRDSDISQL